MLILEKCNCIRDYVDPFRKSHTIALFIDSVTSKCLVVVLKSYSFLCQRDQCQTKNERLVLES